MRKSGANRAMAKGRVFGDVDDAARIIYHKELARTNNDLAQRRNLDMVFGERPWADIYIPTVWI